MEVKAKARYIRMSPKKVRLVVDVIRGMKVDEALHQLRFINKAAAEPVRKLVESAIANAINNNNLDRSDLFIKRITADGGPVIHRWRPRAFGRAAPIRKRMSHIMVTLDQISFMKEQQGKGVEKEDKNKIAPTVKKIEKKVVVKKTVSVKKSAEPKGEALNKPGKTGAGSTGKA